MNVRSALDKNGYAILPKAVPEHLCAEVVQAIEEHAGLAVDRPETWERMTTLQVDQVPVWGHQAQWDIRSLPALHRAWASAWGREDLWVSFDSCRFTPPWRPDLPDQLPLHWEHDPRKPGPRMIQGFVALTDTIAGATKFRCAPAWQERPDRWPASWAREPQGEQYCVEPPEVEIVEVPVAIGDVVMWESKLPHGTTRNLSASPRIVFYVMFSPAGSPDEARRRVDDFVGGRINPAARGKPGHDVPQPWPPATLTDLGERLLGREPWS